MNTNDYYTMNKDKLAHCFRSILSYISPQLNTEITYFVKFKRWINLKRPMTFNEKLLWLKLYSYSKNPMVKECADKYRVRDYINDLGLGELLPNLIAVYDSPSSIEWERLPKAFAMKMNVGCKSNLIVRDKDSVDIELASSTIKKWFTKNYWAGYSELQYKDVERHILVEEYIGDPESPLPPMDYKFYCMNGECRFILVCADRGVETGRAHHAVKYYFFNKQWELLPYTPEALQFTDIHIEKPALLGEAIKQAETLAGAFPFVRVDFYLEGEKVYFGELTFTPAGAMDTELCMIPPGQSKTVDEIFGECLSIDSIR